MKSVALLEILTISFVLASILGYAAHRMRLSPILGYLLAGYFLGPHCLAFVADNAIAVKLADIGIILLMLGVGLRCNLHSLSKVKGIAIPGALGQILAATISGAAIALAFGLSPSEGLVLGLGMAVASSAVLERVLTNSGMIDTAQGYVAEGWVSVANIFILLVVVLSFVLSAPLSQGATESSGVLSAWGTAAIKLALLSVLILPVGGKIVALLLSQLTRSGSRELAVSSVCALAIVIATGSTWIFEIPLGIGAFLAGMVIGQTQVNHQSAARMVPVRDAFAVLFFIALGMLFDPYFVMEHLGLVFACLFIILIVKSMVAGLIAFSLGCSVRTVLTVALGLAHIGDFSYILAHQAQSLKLLSSAGYNTLISCMLISIMLSPILFKSVAPLENWLRGQKSMWLLLNRRAEQRGREANNQTQMALAQREQKPSVIVVGYGTVGQAFVSSLRDVNQLQIIIDRDVDIIRHLVHEGHMAVHGVGSHLDTLKESGIEHAGRLLIALSDPASAIAISTAARSLNPYIRIRVVAGCMTISDLLATLGVEEIPIAEGTNSAMVHGPLTETKV